MRACLCVVLVCLLRLCVLPFTAGDGGGVKAVDCSLSLSAVDFSGNHADRGDGGAAFALRSPLAVHKGRFDGNQAKVGFHSLLCGA